MAELETVGVVRNAVHLQADTLRLLPVPAEGDARAGGTAAAAAGATGAEPARAAPPGAAAGGPPPPGAPPTGRYLLEFTFDATVVGAVTVFYHAREVPAAGGGGDAPAGAPAGGVAARYTGGGGGAGGAPTRTRFAVGLQQVYRQKASAALDVAAGEWVVRGGGGGGSGSGGGGGNVWPLVICLATGWGGGAPGGDAPAAAAATAAAAAAGRTRARGGGAEQMAAGEVTYATLVPPGAGGGAWKVRALKQRVLFEGGMYDMQTIYGIQTPGPAAAPGGDGGGGDGDGGGSDGGSGGGGSGGAAGAAAGAPVEDVDAPGAECVVCLTDPREVFVLPCRHLCLCADCAPDYKRQWNKCPICRKTVVQMVRIRPQQAGGGAPAAPLGGGPPAGERETGAGGQKGGG